MAHMAYIKCDRRSGRESCVVMVSRILQGNVPGPQKYVKQWTLWLLLWV